MTPNLVTRNLEAEPLSRFHLTVRLRLGLNRLRHQSVVFSMAALLLVAAAGRSLAHGTTIEYQSTQALKIQAAYDSGEPMANAQVVVYAPENPSEPWLTGTTDEQGRFIFSPDPTLTGNWDVQVRQAGHGDIISIPVEAADGAIATSTESPSSSGAQEDAPVALVGTPSEGSTASLSPLQKWIMAGSVVWGLFGTAMFFTARSKKNAHS